MVDLKKFLDDDSNDDNDLNPIKRFDLFENRIKRIIIVPNKFSFDVILLNKNNSDEHYDILREGG